MPSGPTPEAPRPMIYEDGSGTIYDGWDGWVEPDEVLAADGELVPCPTNIYGIGPVPYDNRSWTTENGPYVAYSQRVDRTFYRRQDHLRIDFVSLQDGARAVADGFSVSCRRYARIVPFAFFDVMSFQPIGWYVRYDPNGGDGGECADQLIYDPETCRGDPDAGTGGGGGEGGGGGGGGSCHTEYIYVEVSHDGGKTWHTYWEGYATVCE